MALVEARVADMANAQFDNWVVKGDDALYREEERMRHESAIYFSNWMQPFGLKIGR
jgi:hypothetical protein